MFDEPSIVEDPAVAAAHRAVDYAREHLRTIQRQHTRGQTGAATVAAAEAQLSAALDQLEHATDDKAATPKDDGQ